MAGFREIWGGGSTLARRARRGLGFGEPTAGIWRSLAWQEASNGQSTRPRRPLGDAGGEVEGMASDARLDEPWGKGDMKKAPVLFYLLETLGIDVMLAGFAATFDSKLPDHLAFVIAAVLGVTGYRIAGFAKGFRL